MANKRKVAMYGLQVEQIQLQNNWYTGVDERVRITQQVKPDQIRAEKAGFHVVSVQILPVGERWAYHCMVEYPVGSGVVLPGSDFIDMKDPSGLAKAETSAIGRALAFHGVAAEGGIASADEMQRVVRQEERPAQQQSQRPQPATRPAIQEVPPPADDSPVNESQWESIKKLCAALGRELPTREGMTFAVASAHIREMSASYNEKRRQGTKGA